MSKISKSPLLSGLLVIVFGLILLFKPGLTIQVIVRLLGVVLSVGGAVSLFEYYSHRNSEEYIKMGPSSYLKIFEGAICLVAGIVILVRPGLIINLFPIVMGVLLILNGLLNLAKGLDFKNKAIAGWQVCLCFALVTLVLGLVIILFPFKAMETLMSVIGASLIFAAVGNFWVNTRKPGPPKNKKKPTEERPPHGAGGPGTPPPPRH